MHDKAPPQRKPKDLAGYLEALSRRVFQAGISRRVIDSKWDAIREAFAGFDPPTVADYGPEDIKRLLDDPRIVRSKAKIEATIDNAQAMIELDAEHGGFDAYLRCHRDFEQTMVDLQRQAGSSATAAPTTSCGPSASRRHPTTSGSAIGDRRAPRDRAKAPSGT
jgi:3-methyladenine DNA glycosylase Tag